MRLSSVLFLFALSISTSVAYGQTQLDHAQRKDLNTHLQNLTPEQRNALTAQAKTKWQNLTPEQQAHIKARAKDNYDRMTPEQKDVLRQRFKDGRARRSQ